MGCILIQSDDSAKSTTVTVKLCSIGICDFDLTSTSPRLQPLCFIYRANKNNEKDYLSFVSEVSCGRWAAAIR